VKGPGGAPPHVAQDPVIDVPVDSHGGIDIEIGMLEDSQGIEYGVGAGAEDIARRTA